MAGAAALPSSNSKRNTGVPVHTISKAHRLVLHTTMMPLRKKTPSNLSIPVNTKDPVRLAFLGGPKSGKTALISKLTTGTYCDTYYPLRLTVPVLFNFAPSKTDLEVLLDETLSAKALKVVLKQTNVLVSPVVYNALQQNYLKTAPTVASDTESVTITGNNGYYASYRRKSAGEKESGVTPIMTELIDTPAFNPSQIVPFLEASLYVRLDRDVLHKLADVPRQPVSTNPLIVASGASEMNGLVDGYFFVYNAIPTTEPPSYEEVSPSTSNEDSLYSTSVDSAESYNKDGTLKSLTLHTNANDKTFSLLPVMKDALEEAWKEYYTYKTRWELGEERDVFSFKTALKNMWNERGNQPSMSEKNIQLMDTSIDPASPLCPPPIWIVCTNLKSPLASPKLMEDGKNLAKLWRCGFVALDSNEDVEEVLALMIRELVERRKLQKTRKRRG